MQVLLLLLETTRSVEESRNFSSLNAPLDTPRAKEKFVSETHALYYLWASRGGSCSDFCDCMLVEEKESKEPTSSSIADSWQNLSYGTLLRATDGFSSTNLIGIGSFGSVYRGTLRRMGLMWL